MGVRRRKWRGRTRLVVCGLVVLVVVLSSAGAYALTSGEPAPSAGGDTARVDRGDVATAVATTGALEPAQTRTLSFAAAGTVTVVKVRAGDQVKTGQVLAEIDAADAQERVTDAQDALDQAEEALDEAEDSAGTSTCAVSGTAAGQAVPVVLAASGATTPSPVPTPSPSPSPSPSTRPSASPPSSSQPPRSGATQGPGGGQVPGGGASCSGARGGDPVFTAQQRVTSAELTLAEAKDQLAGTKITAPIAGKVLSVAGAVGADIGAGSTFVSLADVAGMQVAADFPEADAGHLKVGQGATVTLANHPGEEFAARVVRVSPVGTADGNMVRYGAVLAFQEVPPELLVGQSAGVRVETSEVTGVLRVPSTAVRGDGTVVVRTATGDESRAVEVGLRGDQFTEIKSGVIDGEEIVIGTT